MTWGRRNTQKPISVVSRMEKKGFRIPALLVSLLLLGGVMDVRGAVDPRVHAAEPAKARSVYDVEYARVGDESLRLDLHLPAGAGPHPVIVWIHEGGWIAGHRRGGPALRQVERGYAVVSISYRFAPRWVFPAQFDDTNAAIDWVRLNAGKYALDPQRIALYGASAGAHLAALAALTNDIDTPQRSRIRAVVSFFGPSDLLQMRVPPSPCLPIDPGFFLAPPSLLIGCPIRRCPERADRANPIRYIHADAPPFLILHGTADCVVPYDQSVLLHEALKKAGVESTLRLVDGAVHSISQVETPHRAEIDGFLDRNLQPALTGSL
jgi:acetyl esterase/lipase